MGKVLIRLERTSNYQYSLTALVEGVLREHFLITTKVLIDSDHWATTGYRRITVDTGQHVAHPPRCSARLLKSLVFQGSP